MSASARGILITVIAVLAVAGITVWLLPSQVDSVLEGMEADDVAPVAQSNAIPAVDAAPFPSDDLPCRTTAYAPVLSSVYIGGDQAHTGLAGTISIRNISEAEGFALTRADYFDSAGRLLTQFLQDPVKVGPLQTVEFYVDVVEREGGSGANFVIGWASEQHVPAPLIETVMIGAVGARGISVVSRAVQMQRSCR